MSRQFAHDGTQWTVKHVGQGGAGVRRLGEGVPATAAIVLFARNDGSDKRTATVPLDFIERASDEQLRAALTTARRFNAASDDK